ncbi:NAD(P)-dependent alcohol dehydrogenase, partial [Campylobacter coli]|nr:NAD(P)-dependent alcohol dehydrogenase [Campylobacter coli]ELK3832199.1 NAD(P)-dependent alcohol dehydrogenase [Campylobacter coli]
ILYAGICHSDIHTARSEWGEAVYPCVPGHEIAGEVIAVGKNVSKFKVGDYAGVGCMVNSCGECEACKKSQEQFCEKGQTIYTYNSCDIFHDNENTYGGYSNNIVVSEKFAVCVPKDAPMEKVAPLLCAGIATYSPLKFSNIKAGSSVAVAGFGGLGMMAVKYAVKERFDLIISTIPTPYDPSAYMDLLKFGGEMAIVGLPPHEVAPSISVITFVHKAGKKVYGSLIGGIAETQEMLDFSLKHKIYPETELITSKDIDKAYENLTSGKAKFRYVIDMRDE